MSKWQPTLQELNSFSYLIKEVDVLSEVLGKIHSNPNVECKVKNIESKFVSKIDELQAAYQKILQWIFGIEDPLIRLIFEERFLNCKTWEQVVCRVGGANTEYSVKQMAYRYLKRGGV